MVTRDSSNEVVAYFVKATKGLDIDALAFRAAVALVRGGIDTLEKFRDSDEKRLADVRDLGEKRLAITLMMRNRYLQSK